MLPQLLLIAVPVGAGQVPTVQTSTPQVVEEKKDKKAKKKLKLQQQTSSDNKSGLDLGELMKDVGLDELDGYNGENNTTTESTASNSVTSVQNAIISSAQQANNQAIMTAPLTLATSGGNQIVAQIPQQIVQVLKNYVFFGLIF